MSDRVFLVTGGASGIGLGVCRNLLDLGARIVMADASAELLGAVDLVSGEQLTTAVVDVRDPGMVNDLLRQIVRDHGRLDGAVNCAGVAGDGSATADVSDAVWRRVLSVNLDGLFHCLRAETAAMRALGAGGSIVNIGSVLSVVGAAGSSAYAASKHGVLGLTRSAALAHAPDRIRVNCVGPGYVDTPLLNASVDAEGRERLRQAHPLGRLGTVEDVATAAEWLLSDRASFVTGAFIPVDGGLTVA